MSSIFLSHSHENKHFARKIAVDLRHAGHIVWIDEAEIRIGDSLIEKIRDGLDRVDYVAAIISNASVASSWVKRELDIASNREIDERRVVVLPLLLDDVELPGFLKGKFYGDFRNGDQYEESFERLLASLGPTEASPVLEAGEAERLREELAQAKVMIEHYVREQERKNVAISANWSPKLREAVTNANKKFPKHKVINEAYAFEVGSIPITLDYLLWAVAKASHRGMHPIEAFLTIENKWQEAQLMLEAYSDYLNLGE
jgi:hypothetical protein